MIYEFLFRAALEQWNNINEYLAVDISNDMNELSQNIMSNHPKKFNKTFYRQYLPVSNVCIENLRNLDH